jgi:hypothetical protein
MLKAFVKTQIYRTLFFDATNYEKFSSDTSKYTCDTTKWFTDHHGITRELKLSSGTWSNNPQVDTSFIPFYEAKDERGITNATYYYDNNKLSYDVEYQMKTVEPNDTFVVEDVQFYVVRKKDQNVVNSIYFNEFQSNTIGQNQVAQVVDNKFQIDGQSYLIDEGEIRLLSMDSTYSQFAGNMWKCDFVDNMFTIDGRRYVVVKDNSGEYSEVRYADDKDNKLVSVLVSENGYAEYKPWGVKFHFIEN